MSKKQGAFDLKLKEKTTDKDLQEIQILQNHTIIRLLSLTTDSTKMVFNRAVIDDYRNKLENLVDIEAKALQEKEAEHSNLDKDNGKTGLIILFVIFVLGLVVYIASQVN